MCLFFKATRILSFCIPVTNTHFGITLTRCFPGPRDAAAPFCLLAGCGGAHPAHSGSGSWTPRGCPGSEHSCLGALRIFIHIPGPQHQFSIFFPVRFGDRRRKEAGWQCIFLGDAAMRILEGRADSVCQEGWSTGTGLSAPLQLCPGLRRLHPPRPRYAREVSGCPGRGRAAGAVGGPDPHPAVLVSTCSCRRETQQLETVNSLSIIILHITRVWLA